MTSPPLPTSGRTASADPIALSVERLSLAYGPRRAVDAVSFAVERGAILCLLGASGSGKSSVLRLIAGLERPTAGRVSLGGTVVAGDGRFVPPERRQVGMVFQDFALFPHLTVLENVAFGLRRRGRAGAESAARELLIDVELADRARSYPHMLSGGERQRVALARALAPNPDVLLLDEPFSSLDVQLRDQMREQTIALLRRRGATAVLVTHDPAEALRVADRVGVLAGGRLAQCGTAAEIYTRPCSPQMACAFGAVNTVTGAIEGSSMRTPFGVFRAPADVPTGPATICIRPQHVALCPAGAGGVGAVVTCVTRLGDAAEVELRTNDVRLIARVPEPLAFVVGDRPHVVVDPAHLFVFPQHGAEPFAAA